ncbi:MAG: zinc ribbon domain-containing protein [Promethearchaeia archaeon]
MIPIISAGDNKKRRGVSIILALLILAGMLFMMLGFFYSSEHFQLGSIRILFTIIVALIIFGVFTIFMIILIKSKNTRQETIKTYSYEHEIQSQDYEYQVKPQEGSKRSREMYCPYCGGNISSDAIFCPNCGNKIE